MRTARAPFAQRDQRVARQLVVDGRRDHRPMGRAQEFAQRTARNPVGLEGFVLEPRDRVEIAGARRADDHAALAPGAHAKTDFPLAPLGRHKSSARSARRARRLTQGRHAACGRVASGEAPSTSDDNKRAESRLRRGAKHSSRKTREQRLLPPRAPDPLLFVDRLDPQFPRLGELRAGAGSGDDEVGLGRDRARDLGSEPLGDALASSRVIFSSEPVKTIVLPASGWPAAIASIGSIVTSFTSASSAASLRGSAKKSAIASATTGPIPPTPDSSSAAFSARAAARNDVPVAEMAREAARIGLADMADSERKQEPVERRSSGARRWR